LAKKEKYKNSGLKTTAANYLNLRFKQAKVEQWVHDAN
jgi:hypothetical protein